MDLEHLTTLNVLHFEVCQIQLKIIFVTDTTNGVINTIVEEKYFVIGDIEFFISPVRYNGR